MLHHISLSLILAVFVGGSAFADTVTLPPHSSTFTGSVRGYWFTSPVDITITGLFVPTSASSAAQSVEVVLLNVGPPNFPATTNDFTSVFRVVGDPSTTNYMSASIPVSAGQIVGILGQRGTSNSYGAGNFVTSIGGQNVTLRRLGIQFALPTNPAKQLWTEPAGSISRVFFTYDLGLPAPPPSAVPEPSASVFGLMGLGLILTLHRRRR